jgi:hypothetical protein
MQNLLLIIHHQHLVMCIVMSPIQDEDFVLTPESIAIPATLILAMRHHLGLISQGLDHHLGLGLKYPLMPILLDTTILPWLTPDPGLGGLSLGHILHSGNLCLVLLAVMKTGEQTGTMAALMVMVLGISLLNCRVGPVFLKIGQKTTMLTPDQLTIEKAGAV